MEFLPTSVIVIVAVSLGIFVQSVLGFAATVVALPILLLVTDLTESIALMAIFLFLFSLLQIPKNLREVDKKIFVETVLAGIPGLALGIYALKHGNPAILKKLLGVFIISFVAYSYINTAKVKIFNKLGVPFAFFGGLFSGLFNTGGPLYVTYIANKLDKPRAIRATIIGVLAVTNFVRVPTLIYASILTSDVFMKSLIVIPFFLISLYLGNRFFNRLNVNSFKNALMIMLLLSGISMLFR